MIKILKNLNKKEIGIFIICFILIFIQVWLDLKMPDYMSKITVLVQTEGSKMSDIIINGLYMLTCAFGSLLSAVFTGFLASKISSNFSKKLRKKIFDKVENLSLHEVKTFSTSSLITRTTNDVTQIEMLISIGLQLLIKAPITAVWAVTKILNKSWQWSTVTAVGLVILLSTVAIITSFVIPRFKKVQKLTDKLNGVTRENLTGIRVVRAFNAEKYQENKFENTNNELTNIMLFNQKKFAFMQPIMYLVMYGLTLSIYFIGAYLIKDALMVDKLPIFGDMIVFSSYAMQVIMAFMMLSMIFMILPRAQVSANRINEVLEEDISIKDGLIDKDTTKEKGTIEFKNVSFKYPSAENYALRNVNLKIENGEHLAVVGRNGSGKTTFIKLMCRLYDVTDGEILINGTDIKEYTRESITGLYSVVFQDFKIFSVSLKDNICANSDFDSDRFYACLENANIKDRAERLADKENTYLYKDLDETGVEISGGEAQKLALARALYKDAPVVILDEPTAALDPIAENELYLKYNEMTSGKISFFISHRLSSTRFCDRILLVKDGKIAESGTHDELMALKGLYYRMYQVQSYYYKENGGETV